uniref:XPGI domain-containing protein n=1 Tax=Toxocara canis TaxID=6265 RepID=A0A183V3D8_TOXCA
LSVGFVAKATMGVTGMWEYMQKFVQPIDISSLRNKRIAIDGHIWLCEVMRGSVAHSSTARKPHISTFYNRCRSLIEKGIEPIVVFDGLDDTPRQDGQSIPLKKDRKQGTGIWAPELKAEICLLNAMGVRWMASKLEGEAQCAQLERRGLVHGCITRDFDYILFGGNNLYQIEFGPGGKSIHDNILLLSMDYISEELCVSRSCLIAMSLMMGCDYYQKGIPGVGVVTALEIVSEFYIMKHDHPQVILDRFKAYATDAVPVRDTDSALKQKLRCSCEKHVIDLREFNPNSDLIANAINVYVVPCVIDYARAQLPKKVAPDFQKTQEILMRECCWDPNRASTSVERTTKKQARERNAARQRKLTSYFPVVRSRGVVAACSRQEGAYCSKREWAAMERLRSKAKLYKFNPVIEVISVPSTSEDVTVIAAKAIPQQDTGVGGTVARRGPKRKLSNTAEGPMHGPTGHIAREPPSKHSLKEQQQSDAKEQEQSGTVTASAVANAPDKSSSPLVRMRDGGMVKLDEQRSDGSASDIIVIEEITQTNALQVAFFLDFH